MKPAISIKNLEKKYGNREVLKGVSFEVLPGKVVALIGPSGSGKTTLLRCLNLLTPFDSGTVELSGFMLKSANLSAKETLLLREKVGMVFQQFNLWPHKTVLQNLILAPRIVKGQNTKVLSDKAKALLNRVGLSEKVNEWPANLSGGQQQRVAIARSLMMDPEVLLLDEITSALDPELVGEVLNVVREIAEEHNKTILIVTHEMAFAKDVAGRGIFMDQGMIVEDGDPKQVLGSPKEERTRQFLKRILRN